MKGYFNFLASKNVEKNLFQNIRQNFKLKTFSSIFKKWISCPYFLIFPWTAKEFILARCQYCEGHLENCSLELKFSQFFAHVSPKGIFKI